MVKLIKSGETFDGMNEIKFMLMLSAAQKLP